MINEQVLSGHWQEAVNKLREKWSQLSVDDLRAFNGTIDQLVQKIQRATGESRDVIVAFLDELSEQGYSAFEDLRAKASDVADRATDRAREGLDSMKQGYAAAEQIVQERPGQAVAMAFGIGLAVGLATALLLRERQQSKMSQARATAEHLGQQLLDALRDLKPESIAKRFKS